MASTPSFLDLAKFGKPNLAPGTPVVDSPLVAGKKTQLQQAAMMKMATLGSPQEQRVIATAMDQGTSMADEEWARDLESMNPLELSRKYGDDVALDRSNYARARSELAAEKAQQRDLLARTGDDMLDAGTAVANLVGGGVVSALTAYDQVVTKPLGLDPASVVASQGLEKLNEIARDRHSTIWKQDQEQQQLEGTLRYQDNQADYVRELAENADADSLWDRQVKPILNREAANAVDTFQNLSDSPVSLRTTGVSALASMLPTTTAIRAIGAARAAKYGTDAAEEMLKVAPLVTGLTESGGAISQAQVEMMSLSEEELAGDEAYQTLRQSMGHEDALMRRALDVGTTAGVVALPGSMLAGKLTAPFDAMPMHTGAGSSALGAARNVTKEVLEEGFQEGNSQLATNLAVGTAIEKDPLAGVGEATATGMIGGLAAAGTLQAPGAVMGSVKEAAELTAPVFSAANDKLEERRDAKRDEQNVLTGTTARATAATNIETSAKAIAESLPKTSGSSTRVMDAALVSPEETAEMVEAYPDLAERVKDGQVRRADVVDVTDKILKDKKATKLDKAYAAIDALVALDKMRRATGDDTRAEIEALEETNVARSAYSSMLKDISTYESTAAVNRIEETVKSLTAEEVQELIPIGTEGFNQLDEATKGKLVNAAALIARVNPLALGDAQIETALAQVGEDSEARKALELARDLIKSFRHVDAATMEINKGAALEESGNYEGVRDDVEVRNNRRNGLPSLLKHYQEVTKAMGVGRTELGQGALNELVKFAKSQLNKNEALNKSAERGTGKDDRVRFLAYNGEHFFHQKGVWVDATPKSIAQARQVYVDTVATVKLAQSLAKAHGLEVAMELHEPTMHEAYSLPSIKIGESPSKATKTVIPEGKIQKPKRRKVGPEEKAVRKALADTRKFMAQIRRDHPLLRLKRPLAMTLRGMGGIDPKGKFATELRGQDIGARQAPGLFRKGGLTDLDNIGIEELEATLPGIANQLTDNGTGYADPQELFDLLVAELNGEQLNLNGRAELEQAMAQVEGLISLRDILMLEFPAATGDEDRAKIERQALDAIETWVREFKGEEFYDAETRQELAEIIAQWGGTIDTAIDQLTAAGLNEMEGANTDEQNGEEANNGAGLAGEARGAGTSDPAGSGNDTGEQDQGQEDTGDDQGGQGGQPPAQEVTPPTTPAATAPVSSAPSVPAAPDTAVTSDPAAAGEEPTNVAAVKAYIEEMRTALVKTSAKRNIALDAFKPNSKGSALMVSLDPAQWLMDLNGQVAELEGAIGRDLTADESEAIDVVLSVELPRFVDRYQAAMNEMIVARTENNAELNAKKHGGKSDRPSWIEMFDNGTVDYALNWQASFPTNFVAGKDENGFTLETRAVQATFMAVTDWMTDQVQRQGRPMDRERVSKMFGMGRTGRVSNAMMTFANFGSPVQSASEAIARGIQDLMGLEPQNDAAIKETQGLFRSMAASALQAMIDAGHLELTDIDYFATDADTGKNVKRQMHAVRLSKDAKDALKPLSHLGSPFGQIMVPGFEKARYIDEVPPRGKDTQMGNRFAEVGKTARETIRRLEEQVNLVNSPVLNLFDALGDTVTKTLLGYKELGDKPEERHNKVKLTQMISKNRSIERGLTEARIYANEAALIGERDGRAMNKVPIHFRWSLSSVGRLQQEGPVTPQGDKIMRELVSVTNSTLDLDNDEHVYALWLAVAQSLDGAMKLAVEKNDHEEVIAEAEALVTEGGALYPAVEMLQLWLQNPEAGLDGEAFAATLAGHEVTPKFVHALLTVARANEAQGTPEFNAFETALALEADGKTDGPINAMMHMGTGGFSEQEIERLAKGGLVFTSQPVSLNEFIRRENLKKGTKAEDLYHLAAARLKQMLSGLQTVETLRVMRLLNALLPKFELGEEDADGNYQPEIGRNIVKNPLTVFLYGSGIDGIAGKITDAMLDTLYGMLDDVAQGKTTLADHKISRDNPMLEEDLRAILGSLGQDLGDPLKAELSEQSYTQMRKAIRESFAEPMLMAIDEVTGGLATNMEMMQKASQVQTLVFQELYTRALQAQAEAEGGKVSAKDGSGAEKLSQASMDLAFQDLMSWAPIYNTQDQSFHIAQPEKTTVDRTVAVSFSDTLKVRPTYLRPADASVKVSPYVTIGTGDGQMMLNIFSNKMEAFNRALPVFDGAEMALDTVFEANPAINESVWKGWTETNVFETLAQGYSQMTARLSKEMYDGLSKDTREAIRKVLTGEDKGPLPMHVDLLHMGTALEAKAEEVAARKAALKKVAVQVDHMAGSMSQHSVEGVTTESNDPLDYAGIKTLLNDLAREELKAIRARKKEKREEFKTAGYAQAPSKSLTEAVFKIGQRVPGHAGVIEISGKALIKRLTGMNGVSQEQKKLFRDLLQSDPRIEKTRYFMATNPAELEAMRKEVFRANNLLDDTEIELGLTYPRSNIAFISNISAETILHEMMHVRTARVLEEYYADAEQSPKHVQLAMPHLEALVKEVLRLESVNPGLAILKGQLSNPLASQASKVGELISYVLTNQDVGEVTKTQRTYLHLQRIIKAGLKLIRNLLNLRSSDMPDSTIFSQVRFNTKVILSGVALEGTVADPTKEIPSAQSAGSPQDARVAMVEARYLDRMSDVLEVFRKAHDNQQLAIDAETKALAKHAKDALTVGLHSGFRMSEQEMRTFEAVHSVILTGLVADPIQAKELNKALFHVQKTLTADMLAADGEVPMDRAQRMADYVTGADGLSRMADGRSDLLATFVALSQTSPEFRAALEKMPMPKAAQKKWDSVDAWVDNIADLIMTVLTRLSLTKASREGSLRKELDRLSDVLSTKKQERLFMAHLSKIGDGVDRVNAIGSGIMSKASSKATDWLDATSEKVGNKYLSKGMKVATYLTALGDKDHATANGEALTTMLNHAEGWHTVRALLREMRGMTESNAQLMRMINRVKFHIDAMRQDAREGTPKSLAKMFNRKVTTVEWQGMHTAFGQTDLTALGIAEAQEIVRDPASLSRRVDAAEEGLQSLAPAHADRYKAKAKALAIYMMTKKGTSQHLLKNGFAIAHLSGEADRPAAEDVTPELVKAIEKLIAYYAYGQLSQESQDAMKALAETEGAGVRAVLGLTENLRQAELEKLDQMDPKDAMRARLNGLAGWLPKQAHSSSAVAVFRLSEHDEKVQQGWTQVAPYNGDRNEWNYEGRAYYVSTVAGKSAFRQGLAQSVHETFMGVNRMTGLSLANTAGKTKQISLAKKMGQAKPGSLDGLRPDVYLQPILDENHQVASYERPMDPAMMEGLQEDTHMGRMLGVWMGRLIEEEAANEMNRELLGKLKDAWDEAEKNGTSNQFVNVANQKDKVIADAWKTLGFRIKADAEDLFGEEDFLPVSKEMVDDAIGYRAASLTDMWTGDHRMNEEFVKVTKGVMMAIGGDETYAFLKRNEDRLQAVVSWAKTTIVVRSVVVSMANVASNTVHLAMRGVPMHTILGASRRKLVEIRSYVKNREEIQELRVQLAANIQDEAAVARIRSRMQALKDANDRMSIAPLIAAGEFNTISEDLDQGDYDLREGKWVQAFTKAVDKLPGGVKTVAKNVVITKDTALFKTLNRSVQYGDFVAKAVLYDHLRAKGKTERQALDVILEEFVQYNRLPGRGRDGLESFGLLWFWNYKLRIMKVLATMVRERPFSALLMMGGVGPNLGIDSAASGSLAGAWMKGTLDYSMGPMMGFNSIGLNPWVNLMR